MDNLFNKTVKLVDRKYWTNYLGLSRTLLAISTLLTLLFNSKNTLFYFGVTDNISLKCSEVNSFSIFCAFNNLNTALLISYIVLLFVIIGLYPRITAILHWWITYSFATSSFAVDGGDQIASIITLILIPICIFDKRKWHWSTDSSNHSYYAKTIAFFAYLLIYIQIFVIYLHSTIGKLWVNEWLNGTALYYWFYNSFFGLSDCLKPLFNIILKSPILLTFSTWGILLLELFLSLGLFYNQKKIRFIFCILGILFHFFIILVHGLVSFSIIMSSVLIIYFLSRDYNFKFLTYAEK